jgi:Flp pilus assembly protein CpaB
MVLAGVLGALLTLNVLRAADETRPVLVAATDLTPGTIVDADSVRVARIHADDEVVGGLLAGAELEQVRGQVVTAAVHEGGLLARDVVRPATEGGATRVMSFPLPRARAVAGELETGDRVDVLAVERDSGRSGYVVTDVEVVAIDGAGSGPLGTDGDLTVSVAVDPTSATRLASALEVATVSLVRSTGATTLDDVADFSPSASVSAGSEDLTTVLTPASER